MATIIGTDNADTVILGFTSIIGQPQATDGADSIEGRGGNDFLHGLGGADTLDGGRDNDTLVGGDGNDRFILRGEILGEADSIDGGAGRDLLDFTGWAVFDRIQLDLGQDILYGGDWDGPRFIFARIVTASIEEAIGSGFSDLLIGDGDANRLEGRDGADTLAGAGSTDTVIGGEGNDRLNGGDGNDSLNPGAGSDTLIGGNGFDTADYRGQAAIRITLLDGSGTALGGPAAGDALFEIEAILGGDFADTLISSGIAAAADNRLVGGNGDDLLEGDAGDTLEGGAGADTYRLHDPRVEIVETGAAGPADRIEAGFDYTLPIAIEDLLLLGTAVLGRGNLLANRVTGNAASNLLDGGAGDDTLDGGAGADVLVGGEGDDVYLVDDPGDLVADSDGQGEVLASVSWTLTGGITRLLLDSDAGLRGAGTLGADSLRGGGGADTLDGGDGADELDGGGGDDVMIGGAGDDLFLIGLGADTLDGGLGDDIYMAGAGDLVLADPGGLDVVNANVAFRLGAGIENLNLYGNALVRLDGTGNGLANRIQGHGAPNRLAGGGGADSLFGDQEDDTLLGGEGADTLLGSDGADVLLGGAGDDLLAGGIGGNRLRGEAGADVFRLGEAAFVGVAPDRLLDFDAAEGDRIAIEAIRLPAPAPTAGPLDPALFAANLPGRLAIAGPSFVYETDAGRLWYDDDWSGGVERVLIAILVGKPALAAADIALF